MESTSTKRVSMTVSEFNSDLDNSFKQGYATCVMHLKTLVAGKELTMGKGLSEEDEATWNTVIAAVKAYVKPTEKTE